MLQKIPNTENIEIKQKFIDRYKQICPDYEEFMKYSLSFLRRSIRVNTLKISVKELVQRLESDWNLTPIPWCKEGFWIDHKGEGEEHRRDVGNLVEHSMGYIYIQEAASMIPPIVLEPKPGEMVLDMCASPGSKTTQLGAMMKNKGLLIANDYKGNRLAPLGLNVQRMGMTNAVLTLMEGRYFKNCGIEFDRILVDAPCSGVGTIRKSLKTLRIWNPNMVKRLAGTQRQLASTAFEILKPGGTMVYSTCTLEPEEDEGTVNHLLETYENAKLEPIKLDIKSSPAITGFKNKEYSDEVKKCLRLWPQDNDTEGFFVAKIKKV